jgi:hypothetical protein
MKRTIVCVLLLASATFGCSPPGTEKEPTASGGVVTPKPGPAKKVGGTYKAGTRVKTEAGSYVTVLGWTRGAPEREAPGPGQVYESIGLIFCAGPDVDVSGRELVPLFSLELPNGNRVSPDSATGKKEMRSKGKIAPGTCTRAPIVFQVGGGTKPKYIVFSSTPAATKWIVP